jgi:hypothetical protein
LTKLSIEISLQEKTIRVWQCHFEKMASKLNGQSEWRLQITCFHVQQRKGHVNAQVRCATKRLIKQTHLKYCNCDDIVTLML